MEKIKKKRTKWKEILTDERWKEFKVESSKCWRMIQYRKPSNMERYLPVITEDQFFDDTIDTIDLFKKNILKEDNYISDISDDEFFGTL